MTTKLLLDVEETAAAIGASRSTVYELCGAGALDARKLASKTVITAESVERFVGSLPKAPIRPQGRRAKAAAAAQAEAA